MSSRNSKPSPLEPKGHGLDGHAKKTHVSEHIPIRGQNYSPKIWNLLCEWIDVNKNRISYTKYTGYLREDNLFSLQFHQIINRKISY